MEATAYFKNVHISPKKLRFLLPDIKKMSPSASLQYLMYSPKKGAKVLHKVIKSVIDNAKSTLKIDENLLKFKLFTVEQGNALKRYRPGGRGTAKPYKKRYSHIKVVLYADKVVAAPKAKIEKKVLQVDSTKKRVNKKTPIKKEKTNK